MLWILGHIFFFLSWQIKHLFLRGKYCLYSVPIYPRNKKSCKLSMSVAAHHSWHSNCWPKPVLLSTRSVDADWLLNTSFLGFWVREAECSGNWSVAGPSWLSSMSCCPMGIRSGGWVGREVRNSWSRNVAWRGSQRVSLCCSPSQPHLKCPINLSVSLFVMNV